LPIQKPVQAFNQISLAGNIHSRLKIAGRLTWLIIALAALASAVGLLVPSVYRETAWVIPQNRGQDLVTLLMLCVLIWALAQAQRGNPRATLIWLGLLGYLAYTYTAAALVYGFNWLFPVYVALFGLTGAALIAGLSGVDVHGLRAAFDHRTPRRAVIVFLLVMSAILCLLWGSQIAAFYIDGTLPPMIERAKTPTVYVFALDLGVVVPLALLCAWWLRREHAWGYVMAGFVLVKSATMGLALISMTVFALSAGIEVERAMTAAWVVLAVAGLSMSFWYFSRCRSTPAITAR
jgi:hypothetical protein